MAASKPKKLELSPSFRERIRRSVVALTGFGIGIIITVGALLFVDEDIILFITVFIGALVIFFSLWRIFILSTTKLYVDEEEIRYREGFGWQRISWSDVISIGRANDIDVEDSPGVLKKIKSLLIMTKNGLRKYDMTSYSLAHGLETVNRVMEYHPKTDCEEIEDHNGYEELEEEKEDTD